MEGLGLAGTADLEDLGPEDPAVSVGTAVHGVNLCPVM